MPKGSVTTLFVSSTCYDLAQIRLDLRDFAKDLGLEPILSELATFPVDTSRTTVENCLHSVRTKADIFLLIVGNRYGSIADVGKSITNLEFAEASARAIPRYVFVKSDVLTMLPVWKANPNADFSTSVDSVQLFEFVSHLRDSGSIWVFPFSSAQDIISTLRVQLSYLLADALDLRLKMQVLESITLSFGAESLRIYVEKPPGWEYLVFAKLLDERVRAHHPKQLDLELQLSNGTAILFADVGQVMQWVLTKVAELEQIVDGATKVVSGTAIAFGPQGKPGDIVRIDHAALRLSDAYEHLLDWTLEFYRIDVHPDFAGLLTEASRMSSNAIPELRDFSTNLYDRIKTAIDSHQSVGSLNLVLKLTLPDMTAFNEQVRILTEKMGKKEALRTRRV